jgi:glycogen operon protein
MWCSTTAPKATSSAPRSRCAASTTQLYYHLREADRAFYENWTGCGNCLNLSEPRVLQLVMNSMRFWARELGVDGFRFDLAPILGAPMPNDAGSTRRAPFFAAVAQDPVLSRTSA